MVSWFARTQEEVDYANSRLVPFGTIVKAYGGWKDKNAVMGALNYCKAQLAKGTDWWERDKDSKLHDAHAKS